MEFKTLQDGKTKVSMYSMGAWAFSGARVWGDFDQDIAVKTIHQAIDAGINLIDSAEKYGDGKSEEVLGEAIKDRRDKVMIATKIYSDMLQPDQIIINCEASLKRLQTDYIDFYLIHWPNPDIPLETSLPGFVKLQEQGKIRHFGVCNFGEEDLADLVRIGKPQALFNQIPYSLLWRHAEAFFPSDESEEKRKRPLAWTYSPLAQGLLTGKFKSIDDVPINRRETRLYSSKWGMSRHTGDGFEAEIFEFLDVLRQITAETGISMAALALGFIKRNEAVGSILIGARNPEQLTQNLRDFETEVPEEILDRIDKLSLELRAKMGPNADLWVGDDQGGGRYR